MRVSVQLVSVSGREVEMSVQLVSVRVEVNVRVGVCIWGV